MSYELLTLCRTRDGELVPTGVAIDCVGELLPQTFTDAGQAWRALDLWRKGTDADSDAELRRCAEAAAALPLCPRCGDNGVNAGRIDNYKCNVCGHRPDENEDDDE